LMASRKPMVCRVCAPGHDALEMATHEHHDFKRRSSSAWAKNALASFRISLARRSSRTPLSRSP
jgi:hypothetical protein